jgi:hypothetical protein
MADLEGAGNTLNRGSRRLASPETGIPLSAVITLGACCDAVAGRFWRRTGHRGGVGKESFFPATRGGGVPGVGPGTRPVVALHTPL